MWVYQRDRFGFDCFDKVLSGYFDDNTIEAVDAVAFQHSFIASPLFRGFKRIIAMLKKVSDMLRPSGDKSGWAGRMRSANSGPTYIWVPSDSHHVDNMFLGRGATGNSSNLRAHAFNYVREAFFMQGGGRAGEEFGPGASESP